MSRIGKKIIEIPAGVQVQAEDGKIIVKGPKGELSFNIFSEIKVEVEEKEITIVPENLGKGGSVRINARKKKEIQSLWGLARSVIANMVEGVSKGFEKKLQIEGLGFKAAVENDVLVLKVGYTHAVNIKAPAGIKISVEKNIITVYGTDKEMVGLTAARIKKVQKPEPYKGKGIRYLGEEIKKKEGKKAIAAAV
jgi:large subunit ribosomal protein L6